MARMQTIASVANVLIPLALHGEDLSKKLASLIWTSSGPTRMMGPG